jgi:hypothetical protein
MCNNNEIQFLTKDQINGLISILEKDYIIPKIEERLNLIKKNDNYKEIYNKIKELSIESNKVTKQLVKLTNDYYSTINVEESSLNTKTLESLNIKNTFNIKREIIEDIKSRLQLMKADNFDIIIESMINYIDVDKYLYNKNTKVEEDDYEEIDD